MFGQDEASAGGWKPGPRLIAAWRGGLDLLLPPQSLDEAALSQSGGFSAAAWSRIVFLDGPVCDGCGAPFAYRRTDDRCFDCLAEPRAFERARAACLYDEASREAILKLKHADRTDLAWLFARWLSRAAGELIAQADAVAPVPMRPGRLLRRRYNQAAEVARPLARLAGAAYLPDTLRRIRDTESQGGKSGLDRRLNVEGAFAVPVRLAHRVAGKRILVVDDVMTTGATAEACAIALKAAGAACVDVAVIARVKPAPDAPI